MYSLHTRLLVAGGVVLACFLGVTGVILDNVFRDSARDAVMQRLQAHIYALIAAADITDRGEIHMPPTLPEARFSIPGSGLYARIESDIGGHRWQSPSMMGISIPFATGLTSTVERFQRLTTTGGRDVFAVSLGISWDQSDNPEKDYTFSVAESVEGYNAQVRAFRRNLWGWLGAVAVVLLGVQQFILRWGLAPLRRAARDLENIESGRRRQLEGPYPKELRGLTDNLNALLRSQRERLDRYRHTLDDLAHSLKTPLAILRGAVQEGQSVQTLQRVIQQQVERMSQIVHYRLQRAATSGRTVLEAPVAVKRTLGKVIASLDKVYADKHVSVELHVEEQAQFYGDEGDLMEVLGNLVDNAYKWCRNRVRIHAGMEGGDGAHHTHLTVRVDDDGPGISEALARAIPRRGMRGDDGTEGHGIGLAIVQDIVGVYQGELRMERSPWGGARLTVRFPA